MSVPVENLLALVAALSQRRLEEMPIRDRLRHNAKAYAEMNLKVQAILKEKRDAEANT